MATISPVRSSPGAGIEKILWETVTEADTGGSIQPSGLGPAVGTIQFTGTFNGGTLTFEASKDGATWVTVPTTLGADISATAAGMYTFSWPALQFRINNNGSGTSEDVDVTVIFRG